MQLSWLDIIAVLGTLESVFATSAKDVLNEARTAFEDLKLPSGRKVGCSEFSKRRFAMQRCTNMDRAEGAGRST